MTSLTSLVLDEVELEERSRASLYHVTPVYYAMDILESDSLGLDEYDMKKKVKGAVSFSRYPLIRSNYFGGHMVRFEVDQEKLRTRYKIIPYSDFDGDEDGEDEFGRPIKVTAPNRRVEAEEYVIGPVKPLSRYLIEIRLQQINQASYRLNFLGNKDTYAYLIKHPKFNRKDKKILSEIVKSNSPLF